MAALTLLVYGQVLLAIVAAAALFFLPDYWVLSVRDDRQNRIQADAADMIDQMTICVEAGLGLDAAIARVATTTRGSAGRRTPTDHERHPRRCAAYAGASGAWPTAPRSPRSVSS